MSHAPSPALTLASLLAAARAAGASDLHLSPGAPPLLRTDGGLRALPQPRLDAATCERLCREALVDPSDGDLTADRDLAFDVAGVGRCRGSLFRQRDGVAGAFRLVTADVPALAALGLPSSVLRIVAMTDGLVLVAGATGSGKSTTLAALIAAIREARSVHVLTIEDPIEFVHPADPGLINQREVGRDAASFAAALRHVLRQDPDVILIGEMRDVETMRAALTLAETGHLVLSTLHCRSAVEVAERMVDAFPAGEQGAVRRQVATVLRVALAQRMFPRRGGGRVVACEVMFVTPAIRALIREDKAHQILSHVQAGRREHGMRTMADAIVELERAGLIEPRSPSTTAGAAEHG